MAGITIEDVQVIELHDAFIPQLMITLAEMGVVPLGEANDLVEEGIILPGGKLLVNPSGGLVFRRTFGSADPLGDFKHYPTRQTCRAAPLEHDPSCLRKGHARLNHLLIYRHLMQNLSIRLVLGVQERRFS